MSVQRYNVTIVFHCARNLLAADITGTSDPYVCASIDSITYKTAVKPRTLNPVWEEVWQVNNVASDSSLMLEIWDEDFIGRHDYLGSAVCQISQLVSMYPLGKSTRLTLDVIDKSSQKHGEIDISIAVTTGVNIQITNTGVNRHAYKIHTSTLTGLVTGSTATNNALGYLTYSLEMFHVSSVFRHRVQGWNQQYAKAQQIFGPGAQTSIVRAILHVQHSSLYLDGLLSTSQGFVFSFEDFLGLFSFGQRDGKQQIYTYVLVDDALRFSETGAAVFKDFMSKHAMHANGSKEVRYAGEFHVRPLGNGKHKLVFDNNSGTYSPSKDDLPLLVELFKLNFGDNADVEALDFKDPKLAKYKEEMK